MTEWLERNGFIKIPTQSLTDDEIQVLKSILGEPLEERSMRLIDADLIQYEPMLSPKGNGMYEDVMVAYKSQIDDLPIIEERKTGKWIPGRERSREYIADVCINIDYEDWHCSECGYVVERLQPVWNYCPNCGSYNGGGEK